MFLSMVENILVLRDRSLFIACGGDGGFGAKEDEI